MSTYSNVDYFEIKNTARTLAKLVRSELTEKFYNEKNRLYLLNEKTKNYIENSHYNNAAFLINFDNDEFFLRTKTLANVDFNFITLNQALNSTNENYDASKSIFFFIAN